MRRIIVSVWISEMYPAGAVSFRTVTLLGSGTLVLLRLKVEQSDMKKHILVAHLWWSLSRTGTKDLFIFYIYSGCLWGFKKY